MGLATSDVLAPFDLVGVKEDVSDVVAEILLGETSLLSRIGISGVANAVTHSWLENSLAAVTITAAEALTNSDTTFDITTGQGARVRVGTLLRNRAKGKTEVIQVTAVSTDQLTIVRGYGSTSGEAHDNAAVFDIVGAPRQSGSPASADASTVRSTKSAICQIFERTVGIAGDSEAVLKWGVASEVGKQAGDRLMELTRELDRTIIMGIQSADAGSDTSYRSMGGLIEKLSAANGNGSSTDEDLSPDVLNNMNELAYNDGGMPSLIVCGQAQMGVISNFDVDKIRRDPNSRIAGQYINRFLFELGNEAEIIVERWCPPDTVLLLDPSRITVMPLIGRAFFMQELGKTGDKIEKEIIGDYTLEVRNALEAHAIHTNLTVPA